MKAAATGVVAARKKVGQPTKASASEEIDSYRTHFDALSELEQQAIEAASLQTGNPFKVQMYNRLRSKSDALWQSVRWDLIRSYLVAHVTLSEPQSTTGNN